MDTDLLKCCIIANVTDVEFIRDDDNLDTKGILVRSNDGKIFRISINEVK